MPCLPPLLRLQGRGMTIDQETIVTAAKEGEALVLLPDVEMRGIEVGTANVDDCHPDLLHLLPDVVDDLNPVPHNLVHESLVPHLHRLARHVMFQCRLHPSFVKIHHLAEIGPLLPAEGVAVLDPLLSLYHGRGLHLEAVRGLLRQDLQCR